MTTGGFAGTSGSTTWGRYLLLCTAMIALLIAASSCGDDDNGALEEATPQEIVAEPDDFMGEVVVVEGEITTILAAGMYLLDDDLLVVDPTGFEIARGAQVSVTGEVEEPDEVDFEEQVGISVEADFSLRNLIDGYEAALVASEVEQ